MDAGEEPDGECHHTDIDENRENAHADDDERERKDGRERANDAVDKRKNEASDNVEPKIAMDVAID